MTKKALLLVGVVATTVRGFQGPELLPPRVANDKVLTDAVEKLQQQSPLLYVADDETFASPQLPSKIAPLEETLKTNYHIPMCRHATKRKRWGLDDDPSEYWFNNRIHTFGNTGLFGGLHAAMAPLSTFLIDVLAYEGENARLQIARDLRALVEKPKARVLDMCCGVGMSTRALKLAFHDAEAVIGVDTSPEMLSMAKVITSHEAEGQRVLSLIRDMLDEVFRPTLAKTKMYVRDMVDRAQCVTRYVRGNAQRTVFPAGTFDLITIMYAFHEAPRHGRYLMLREARRLLKDGGKVAIIDICPTYTPSVTMLAGEPYVIEYQKNIQDQINKMRGFADITFESVVPGHVVMWTLERSGN